MNIIGKFDAVDRSNIARHQPVPVVLNIDKHPCYGNIRTFSLARFWCKWLLLSIWSDLRYLARQALVNKSNHYGTQNSYEWVRRAARVGKRSVQTGLT